MTKRLARLIALLLVLSLWATAPWICLIRPVSAQEAAPDAWIDSAPPTGEAAQAQSEAAPRSDAPSASETAVPEKSAAPTQPPHAPSEAPSAAPMAQPFLETPVASPPSGAPLETPVASPPSGAPLETPVALPPSEAPFETPVASPPSGAPLETPVAVPNPSPEAPAATMDPAEAAIEAPDATPAPSETPAAPEVLPASYRVSPGEATHVMGSTAALTFGIEPRDAPFLGVEGMECAHAGGVVTLGAAALSALGEGSHVLMFLFEDGARGEVPLKVTVGMVGKGPMVSLIIGGTELAAHQLDADLSNPAQGWAWSAATATLTLSGYSGGRICASGTRALTVLTAAGTVNTVAASEDGALFSSAGLILTGGGALNVTSGADAAVLCAGAMRIEGGTVRASGKNYAFRSKQDEIRISGGKIEARQSGGGEGFSGRRPTRIDGASVAVEGADAAFGALVMGSGAVAIRNCRIGVSGDLSALGGSISMEDVESAVAGGAIGISNCALNVTGCGAHGLRADGNLAVGKGAVLQVEAGGIALYAAKAIKIEKGANLDLSGGQGALKGAKVVIGGKAYAGAHNHVVIRNGAIALRENAPQSLAIGGQTYGASRLAGDLCGGGWAWAAATRTLTLRGYDGGAIRAVGSPIALALQGENVVRGDLAVFGAVVTGSGALTADCVLGEADLEVRSGALRAERIALGGNFLAAGGAICLSGGARPAVECTNFSATGGALTLSAPPGAQPAGIRASGTATIRGGAIVVENFGDFLRTPGGVTIAGGSIRVEGAYEGIASGKAIKATGGDVSIMAAGCAMSAGTISIGGSAWLRLESADGAAFSAKSVKIGGKAYAPRYPGVIIERGKLVEGYKLQPDLIIGGRAFSMKALNAADQSGDGWSWSARKNALALSGYRGEVWINRALTVALAAGTISGDGAAMCATENLTLTGSGRWRGGLYAAGGLKITGSPMIAADSIRARGDVAILGGRIEVSGGIESEGGDVRIEGGRVTAGRVRGARVTIRKSALTTTQTEGEADILGDRSLAISGSIVFCTRLGAPGGSIKLSGSPVFRRGSDGGGAVWTLAESASIARDMAIPPGKRCVVPAGRALSVAKGKRLYVYGSLAVEGALKGAVVRRGEAAHVIIRGGAQVARGRSIPLTAEVVSASPGERADQSVCWFSDRPALLSVSAKGVVTAAAGAKPGDAAFITCRALDGTGVEATVRVRVTEPVTKISILANGAPAARLSAPRSAEALALAARVDPEGAFGGVRWTSSNPAVASVDRDSGAVKLLKKGSATITCAATDGTKARATIKLTVK